MPPIAHFRAADKIKQWIDEVGLEVMIGNAITDPNTFEPSRPYYFKTAEDKTLFLLRWSEYVHEHNN